MAKLNKRQRDWCFTINNYTDEDICSIACMSTDAKYLVCGFEVGDKGVPHMQGYVYFEREKSLRQLKEYNNRAHYERRMAPKTQDAADYCKKENDYVEFGVLPTLGGDKVTFDRIEKAMISPTEDPIIYMRYKKGYDLMKQDLEAKKEVETKYFVIDNTGDPITEILTYFDWDKEDCKSLAVVTDLVKLDAYRMKDIEKIIYFCECHELEHDLWPRGVPISYKYGYEIRVIRPKTFVVVTNRPKDYKLYKYIKY